MQPQLTKMRCTQGQPCTSLLPWPAAARVPRPATMAQPCSAIVPSGSQRGVSLPRTLVATASGDAANTAQDFLDSLRDIPPSQVAGAGLARVALRYAPGLTTKTGDVTVGGDHASTHVGVDVLEGPNAVVIIAQIDLGMAGDVAFDTVIVDKDDCTLSIQGGRDPVAESSEHRALPDLCAALRPPLVWRHSERNAKFVRTIKMPPQTDLDHVRAHYHTLVDRDDTLVITVMKTQLSAMEEVPIAEDEEDAVDEDGTAHEDQAK